MVKVLKKKKSNKSKKKILPKCDKNLKILDIEDSFLCVGRCPHAGGDMMLSKDKKKLVCKLHGSQFNLKGKVIEGTGPATSFHGDLFVKKLKK